MKKENMKKLALLGLASGLLAATVTAEAADKSNANSRAPNASSRTQPVASTCGGGGCGAVADNYSPTAGCPHRGLQEDQVIQSGCQGRSYQSNETLDGGTDPYPGQQARAPQSSFRYVGENDRMAPKIPSEYSQSRPVNSQPLPVNRQSPSATFTPSYNERPASNPSYSTGRPVNAQQRFNQSRIADDYSSYGHEETAPTSTTPSKGEAPKKTFW